MKKLTLCLPLPALLLVMLAFVSCHKPGTDEPAEDMAIGMMSSSVSNRSSFTRAIIDNLDAFKTQGNFGVFGWKEATNPYSLLVFDNVEVKWEDSDSDGTPDAWQYDPLRYWDKSAIRYYFGAYAPYTAKEETSADPADTDIHYSYAETSGSPVSRSFTLSRIPQWQLVDSCVATKLTTLETTVNDPSFDPATSTYSPNACAETNVNVADVMTAYSHNTPTFYTTQQGTMDYFVQLDFKHILAQMEFKVRFKSGPNNVVYHVMGLELKSGNNTPEIPLMDNVFTHQYTFEQDGVTDDTFVPAATNTLVKGTTASLYPTGVTPGVKVISRENVEHLICCYLVAPFEVTNSIDLVVHYTAEVPGLTPPETFTPEPFSLKVDATTLLTSIEAGKKYTTTIVFDKGQLIDLLDVAISEWKDVVNDDHDVYNW